MLFYPSMNKSAGFDTDKYLRKQVEVLMDRVSKFERLYLEFGGKLFSDTHAKRVLPGYRPAAKMELLKKLGRIEIFYCVSSIDLSRGKIRGDSGLSYDLQTLKDIEDIESYGMNVSGVIISLYKGQSAADQLKDKLENMGFKAYFQYEIEGYPHDLDKVLEGYKKQPYIPTNEKLVVVTGAGGGSGKMAFCLSQIYSEYSKKIKSGFAKFETFPIWNLAPDHLINIAYEASTADLGDYNKTDLLHRKYYGIEATNYNRDIENFNILQNILKKITGEENPFNYKSPTDMGVNMAGYGIVNENTCIEASREEIIRRYFTYHTQRAEGRQSKNTIERIEEIMKKAGLTPEQRSVVVPARVTAREGEEKGKGFKGIYCGSAIKLGDGMIITGKNSPIFHSESSCILNALKYLAGIPDEIHLINPEILKQVSNMKAMMLDHNSPSLSVSEMLIVLASSANDNGEANKALNMIGELRDCEMHSSVILSSKDLSGLRDLGINITSDPVFARN